MDLENDSGNKQDFSEKQLQVLVEKEKQELIEKEMQNFSEEENDLNVINLPKTKKILEDDSDVDEPSPKESVKPCTPSGKENRAELEISAVEATNSLHETGNKISDTLTSVSTLDYEAEIDNDDDEQNIEIKHKKKSKRIAILDSDSEDELNINDLNSKTNVEVSSNILENHKLSNENEGDHNVHVSKANENHEGDLEDSGDNNGELKLKKRPKRIAIIDSDSEEEISVTPHNKSFNDELDTPQMCNDTSVYVINKKGNLVVENKPEILQEDAVKKSRFAALCDSDSSEDESRCPTSESPQKNQKRANPPKKRLSKTSAEEPSGKKMTGKQAQQQRQEIRSESQRMLRESRVSLPYHIPKAHSIKEFLQNRPRLSLAMLNTDNTPPSLAMKMSVQELEVVTKKLEERKKVVQEFYKSESESEEEDVQSEDTKTVNKEGNDEDKMEIVENKVTDEGKQMEILENAELVTNNEDKVSAENCSESKEEGIIKEIVQDTNLFSENREANFENLNMEVDIHISEIDGDATEKIDSITEIQEISAATNVTEEKMNDMVDELMTFNRNDNEPNVPEGDNNELKIIKSNICENGTNIYKAPVESSTSLEGQETSSENTTENNQEIEESNKQPSSVFENCEDSVDFDFNLDGLDEDLAENAESNCEILEKNSEHNEKDIEEEHLQRLLKKYEEYPDSDCIESVPTTEKKINKIDLLKQIGTSNPCLSGGPDEIIDLDEGITKPSEVAQLMERFMKHALTKNVVKNKVQLDIINLTQGEVIKETVAMSVEPEEEPVAIMERPGIKLKKLRDELQSQIAQRRSELWLQKHQPHGESLNKETFDDEKSDCGADEDILDDEEEAELTDIEDEEEDEYEDEITKKPVKPRVKSAFVDEEAEESDEDECDEMSQQDDEEPEEKEDEEPEENEDTVQEDSNECQSTTRKKPLRRILKGFTEDSDEEEESQLVLSLPIVEESDTGIKNTSFTSLNTTESLEDNDTIPPNQLRIDKTPHKEMTQTNPVFGLLTPVQHLTGLQDFNSGSKFVHTESPVSPFRLPPDPSPLKDRNWNTGLQKKLFSDSCDTLDSETNMEDIAQLCSGTFPSQTQAMARPDSPCFNTVVESLATQDVISMCSGSFPNVIPASNDHQKKDFDHPLPIYKEANTETEILSNKGPIMEVNLNSNKEIKNLDDDRFISELLDEEEMEQFKKKFESPIAATLSTINDYESEMEVMGGGRLLSDSSDDESEELKNKSTKKLQKRLAFSDDSDSEDEDNKDDEEINLNDDCSDNEFDDVDTNKIIDYDSEENEIELDTQEEVPKQKLKLSDFLENEAELSESDWDSADEDERGLDALETEQGDADVFDENEMRNDLEKIHMRRVLDQDNREIKILQELLLEDGELHGTGRQRQFRWKNIDDAENAEDGQRDAEIEAYLDEEESEEQWRRARHQREMFLKGKQEKHKILDNDDFISTDTNSQILKLGQEAVRKSLSAAPTLPDNPKPTTSSPEVKKPLMLLNTRGSFLARTDKFLCKLAEFTKVTTTATGGLSKNAKKIVFQTVDATKEIGVINNKRKLENQDKTPKIIKKLRLSSNLTPVVKKVDRKKQLF